MKGSRYAVAAIAALIALGCSGMLTARVHNFGPGAVEVAVRVSRGPKDKVASASIPEGGVAEVPLWFAGPPPEIEIEARWQTAVKRARFRSKDLPADLRSDSSAARTTDLVVSPAAIRWENPDAWKSYVLNVGAGCAVLAFLLWWRGRRRRTTQPDDV